MIERMGFVPCLAVLLLSTLVSTDPAMAAESPFCVPDEAVRRSLLEFERLLTECGRRVECWEKEREILEVALESHPEDPHLHRAYQDLFKRWTPSERRGVIPDLESWYQRLVEEDPDNATYLYAYGRHAEDPTLALSLFERAVEVDPDFPWGHVGLAYVCASRDPARLKEHLGRFIELCPSRSKVALSYAPQIDDPRFWFEHLPRLRAALAEEPVAGTYVHYSQIWQLELAHWAKSERDSVREQIARDLERIAALEFWDNAAWTTTLRDGYLLIGDGAKLARLEGREPGSSASVTSREDLDWQRFVESLEKRRFEADFLGPLRDLGSGDSRKQAVALNVLGASAQAEAIPHIVPFLDSSDSSIQVQAGLNLYRIVERIELRRRDMSRSGRVVLRERTAQDVDLTPLRAVVRKMLTSFSNGNVESYAASMAGYIGLHDLEPELRSLLGSRHPAVTRSATYALELLGHELEPEEEESEWVVVMGKYERRHASLVEGAVPSGAEKEWFECERDNQCVLGHDPCGGHWGINFEFAVEAMKWSKQGGWHCTMTPELDNIDSRLLSCASGFCRIAEGFTSERR